MKIGVKDIFFILFLSIHLNVLGCIDDKGQADSGTSANNGFPYSTMFSGRTPSVLSPQRIESLKRNLITQIKKQPCVNSKEASQRALRKVLFQQVIRERGVPYTQLYTLLQDVVAPHAKDCDEHSCTSNFGLKIHEVPKFLEVSERATKILESKGPDVATLRSSFALPTPGGEWKSPGLFGPKAFSAKGFTTVYTYQEEKEFLELVGQPLDVNKHEEARELAKALLYAKMERGPEGNKNIHSPKDLIRDAMKGYGLYAATDPFQSQRFGEILIAFDIPNTAYYTITEAGFSKDLLKQIHSSVFGIIYPWDRSVSGNKVVVLRLNPIEQPLGQPVIPGSVRVFRKSTTTFAALDQLAKTPRVRSGNPAKDFMENYGNHLELFQDKYGRSNPESLREGINKKFMHVLINELKSRPQWVKDGIDRLRRIADTDPDIAAQTTKHPQYRNKVDQPEYFADVIIDKFELNMGISGKKSYLIPFLTKFVKAMELIPDSFATDDLDDLQTMIVTKLSTPARLELVEAMTKDWNEVVQYWAEHNIDALAKLDPAQPRP